MEWRTWYMDLILIPLGLVMNVGYHVWLWHKVRTEPFLTIFGIDADGRSLWVPAMLKDIDKKNIVAVQSIRNMIMGSVLMASTSILLCCGLGAVISCTYTVKKPLTNSIFGAHDEELAIELKFATLFTIFLFSFLFHSQSIRFLNQLCLLICTPQDEISLVNAEYLTEIFRRATVMNVVGNRVFYMGLSLLLWIFGPLMTFLFSLGLVVVFRELDFVSRKNDVKIRIEEKRGIV